jgi:hypothetical protein
MNTLQSHTIEYEQGFVSELGFAALDEAEGYDAASSIGACSASLAHLWRAIREGKTLKLFRPGKELLITISEADLHAWCTKHFQVSYNEYLRRIKR